MNNSFGSTAATFEPDQKASASEESFRTINYHEGGCNIYKINVLSKDSATERPARNILDTERSDSHIPATEDHINVTFDHDINMNMVINPGVQRKTTKGCETYETPTERSNVIT